LAIPRTSGASSAYRACCCVLISFNRTGCASVAPTHGFVRANNACCARSSIFARVSGVALTVSHVATCSDREGMCWTWNAIGYTVTAKRIHKCPCQPRCASSTNTASLRMRFVMPHAMHACTPMPEAWSLTGTKPLYASVCSTLRLTCRAGMTEGSPCLVRVVPCQPRCASSTNAATIRLSLHSRCRAARHACLHATPPVSVNVHCHRP